MENLNKYIGLNFKFKNSPETNSYNCIGFIEKFYKDHNYNIKFNDKQPWCENRNQRWVHRILRWLKYNFIQTYEINDLEFGDIIYLKPSGHTAIYLGDYKILCMEFEAIDNVSKSRIYEKDEWIDKFKYGFKRKNN